MKIVIVGVGKVGKTLVENFVNENHDVVVIDSERSVVEKMVNAYDVKGIVGGGLEREVLVHGEAMEADLFIASTSRDEINILSCVLAKKMGAKRAIARVRDPECLKEMENLRDDLGLELLFNPEKRTAYEIENALKFPSAKRVEVFAGGRAIMVEFEIEKGNPIVGKKLMEVTKNYGSKILFCMVTRGNKEYIPNGSFVIEKDDRVQIIGGEKDVSAFCKKTGMFRQRAKSIMIIGGGKIAVHLASELCKSVDVNVKIIEEDKAVCHKLAEILPRATVICGDGTDQSLLNEEKIGAMDACVTVTDFDESNVVISLYALQKNVGKVITKINRTSIYEMAEFIGLDTVVSPRKAIANQIIGYARSLKTENASGIYNFYKLGGDVEATEFEANDKFPHIDIPLKDLKIKPNTLIGGIVRGGEFILPSGETVIKKGDKVIVVSLIKQITDLAEVFK